MAGCWRSAWKRRRAGNPLLLHEAAVLGREAADAAAAVEQGLIAAGPGRMRLRVDVQMQLGAVLAVGRTGLVLRAVGHHHGDRVIVRMDVFLHGSLRATSAV